MSRVASLHLRQINYIQQKGSSLSKKEVGKLIPQQLCQKAGRCSNRESSKSVEHLSALLMIFVNSIKNTHLKYRKQGQLPVLGSRGNSKAEEQFISPLPF